MRPNRPYWKGMCEECPYAKDFSIMPPWWHCDFYDVPMFQVENCSGPKKLKEPPPKGAV